MMIFLMLFVFLEILPTLEPILVDVTLPLLTRILMGISHFCMRTAISCQWRLL